jgi:hypothetical protein
VPLEAGKRLRFYIDQIESSLGFQAKPLKGDDLKFMNFSLKGAGIHNILFTSPWTKYKYMPNDYVAVANLISANIIAVFEFQVSTIYKVATNIAYYLTNGNAISFSINQKLRP